MPSKKIALKAKPQDKKTSVQPPIQTRTSDDVVDAKIYECTCCGRKFKKQQGNFYSSSSAFWAANNGYTTYCKKCCESFLDHYRSRTGDDYVAFKIMCMHLDWYYDDEMVDAARTKCQGFTDLLKEYNTRRRLSKSDDEYIAEKTYDDVEAEGVMRIESAVDLSGHAPISSEMLSFWGLGFSEDDYVELDNEYKDWTSKHQCETKAQESLFKSIAMAQLTLNKAYQSGDVKRIKDASDNLQNLMGSANIKPNQKTLESTSELTYGQWIQKIENTRPISEISDVWKDVDNIGHYVRCWVLSPVLKMLGVKNPYKKEYEEELAKYTVEKPQYSFEEVDDNIRDKLFNIENTESG